MATPAQPHICVLCVAHELDDKRVYWKEVRSILDQGYRVTFVGRAPKTGVYPEPHSALEIIEMPLREVKLLKRLVQEFFLMFRYWKMTRGIHCDIIHCHEPQSVLVALFAGKAKSAKVVYDCHEYQPESFAGFFGRLRPLMLGFFNKLEWWYSRRVHGIVTVNQELVGRYEQVNSRVVLLPNYPVARGAVAVQAAVPDLPAPRFIYQGGCSQSRGLLTCIDFIKLFHDAEIPATLQIVGPASEFGIHDLLKRHVASLGLASFVQIEESVSEEELWLRMTDADFGLFFPDPNEWRYVQEYVVPIKFFDYAQAGLPVIFSDVPGLRRIVSKVGNGLLVDYMDYTSGVSQVLEAWQDPSKMEAMRKNGIEAIENELSWDAAVNGLFTLYESLLSAEKA